MRLKASHFNPMKSGTVKKSITIHSIIIPYHIEVQNIGNGCHIYVSRGETLENIELKRS